ncbi:MAG: protein kinase [Acidimicrobiia bacterium]|nr:protein kinase [Acidimicrobiia bacterium]NNC74134.1 protein kinase [Acidimicrobiia bacterium]
MPTRLPDRYELQVRLGRHDDLEEWLATDTALDRPVLVRFLGPEAPTQRVAAFLESVRAAASVQHVHLAEVYALGSDETGAYVVSEWAGGVTLEDRIHAGESIPVDEYLPNAAGLAEALAMLHRAGRVHGAVRADSIQFSAAHPAKLGGFGLPPATANPAVDTAALASTLQRAVTMGPDVPPSHVAAGLHPLVDTALADAKLGVIDATEMAAALRSAPSPSSIARRPAWSWTWVTIGGVLVAAALILTLAGLALQRDPSTPFLAPSAVDRVVSPTTTVQPNPAIDDRAPLAFQAAILDPFGDGTERDADLPLLADGNEATAWQSEAYSQPLVETKPGIGVTFALGDAVPVVVEVVGSVGIRFELGWQPTDDTAWERIAWGSIRTGEASFPVPERSGGAWRLWLTSLPLIDGSHQGSIQEVRFLP